MKFYLAPLEGITGYIFRNAHREHFTPLDRYFAPFIVADQQAGFKSKDRNDVLPENNQGMTLIPQIMTNSAADFNHTLKKIQTFGYDTYNLNLGCPSGTVVSKKRGAGLLSDLDALSRLLEGIYNVNTDVKISIKTRIGIESPEEFYKILPIYNQYPLEELIIHPRLQKDMYKNKPNLEMFKYALENSHHSICYNGDLFTLEDYNAFVTTFPEVEKVMFGRGLLRNPDLIDLIKGREKVDKEKLRVFHDKVYVDYQELLFGERNVLFKMKELWFYLQHSFKDSEKHMKKIKKAEKLRDYDDAVRRVFIDLELI